MFKLKSFLQRKPVAPDQITNLKKIKKSEICQDVLLENFNQ